MKRIKNEQMKNIMSQYMKRRHYPEAESQATGQKAGTRGQTTALTDMSVKKQSTLGAAVENSITCSSITGDLNSSDTQFARLRKFVQGSPARQSQELSSLLYPVFVHIYTSLLAGGQKMSAYKFHERHSEAFQGEDQKDFIRSLRKLESRTEMQAAKDVSEFREHKYSVRLSHCSVKHLLDYLKAADNMIILQIINQHISFQVMDGKSLDFEPSHAPPATAAAPPATQEADTKDFRVKAEATIKVEGGIKVEAEVKDVEDPWEAQLSPAEKEQMRKLREISQKVRQQAAPLPPIKFYTFINAYQGLCTSTISPDSSLLAGGFEDSSIQVWRLQPITLATVPTDCSNSHIALAADYIYKDEQERQVKVDTESDEAVLFRAHSAPVYKVQFTPDSLYMLSCSRDTTVRLWDMQRRTNIAVYRGHSGCVWDLDFCAATCHFATSSRDQTVKLWTLDRAYPLRCFIGHTHDVEAVAIHPNGNYVASGSCDKTIRLWNIQDSKPMRLLTGHKGSVLALAFSPNGRLLASAGEDRRVHVWDLGSGLLLKELRGHTDTVYALAFSACNRMLASGGADCMLRCWDVRMGDVSSSSVTSEGHTSAELQSAFPTKSATISFMRFERYHLLQAAGSNH